MVSSNFQNCQYTCSCKERSQESFETATVVIPAHPIEAYCRHLSVGNLAEFGQILGWRSKGPNFLENIRAIFMRKFVTQKQSFVPTSFWKNALRCCDCLDCSNKTQVVAPQNCDSQKKSVSCMYSYWTKGVRDSDVMMLLLGTVHILQTTAPNTIMSNSLCSLSVSWKAHRAMKRGRAGRCSCNSWRCFAPLLGRRLFRCNSCAQTQTSPTVIKIYSSCLIKIGGKVSLPFRSLSLHPPWARGEAVL